MYGVGKPLSPLPQPMPITFSETTRRITTTTRSTTRYLDIQHRGTQPTHTHTHRPKKNKKRGFIFVQSKYGVTSSKITHESAITIEKNGADLAYSFIHTRKKKKSIIHHHQAPHPPILRPARKIIIVLSSCLVDVRGGGGGRSQNFTHTRLAAQLLTVGCRV